MLVSKAPLRVSFCGGGSDIASFYNQHDGAVLTSTIQQYVYVVVNKYFDPKKYHLKYSKTEEVGSVEEIQHPIIKAVIKMFQIPPGIEICSLADIHSGTGLGSSSTFTVALINALYAYKYPTARPSALWLAERACEIEIDILKEPIGKQDQYASAFGDPLMFMKFEKRGHVQWNPVFMDVCTDILENRLLMFHTGQQRDTRSILKSVSQSFNDYSSCKIMRRMVALAYNMRTDLTCGRLDDFGDKLNIAWEYKKQTSPLISNQYIDQIYDTGIKQGALGGKLLGAGGSGFMLFYCPLEKQEALRNTILLRELPFKFNFQAPTISWLT